MIQAIDFRRQWEDLREDASAAFEAVGASGRYVLGDEVRAFEQELAGLWGFPHAAGVGSGLDAIEIALRALGCGPGDRVLTTPISAFATTLAIVKIGAVPVFVDTDDQGLIDLQRCEQVREIRFFVPVHLYGFALDADALRRLRDRRGWMMVEDCAQIADRGGRPGGDKLLSDQEPGSDGRWRGDLVSGRCVQRTGASTTRLRSDCEVPA